ncbi:FeoA family protein, partial [Ligilactobacillus ruminis]
ELRRRLMDMGLTRNTIVTVQQIAPLGDPVELTLRGYKLSLRKSEAANIMVKEASL